MQYDAFDIDFLTTDDFSDADIMEATYPAVAKRLNADWISDPAIPIVTGFLGKVLCHWFPRVHVNLKFYVTTKSFIIFTSGSEVRRSDYIR